MQNYQNYFNPQQNYNPGIYQQPSSIIGRFVNDMNMITANDVPMNGQPALFPKSDLSEIEVRQWGNNGLINKVTYVPKIEPKIEQTSNVSSSEDKTSDNGFQSLITALDDISNRLDLIEKAIAPKTTRKKEVVTDE